MTGDSGSPMFPGLDVETQAVLGQEFGDHEFGTLGKDQLESFFATEEAECLKEHQFIEEEPCTAGKYVLWLVIGGDVLASNI